MTEAPESFAAAIFDLGVMDAVRAEESGNEAQVADMQAFMPWQMGKLGLRD